MPPYGAAPGASRDGQKQQQFTAQALAPIHDKEPAAVTEGERGLTTYSMPAPYGHNNGGLSRSGSSSGLATTSYMRGVMHQQAATRVSEGGMV